MVSLIGRRTEEELWRLGRGRRGRDEVGRRRIALADDKKGEIVDGYGVTEVGRGEHRMLGLLVVLMPFSQLPLLVTVVVVVDGISAHVVLVTAYRPWQGPRSLEHHALILVVSTRPGTIATTAKLSFAPQIAIGMMRRDPSRMIIVVVKMLLLTMLGRRDIPGPREATLASAEHPKGHGACPIRKAAGGGCGRDEAVVCSSVWAWF